MKPLGDAFIKTIKMIIAPIIFCRPFFKSLYFQVLTAIVLGVRI
jgi:Na+/H+-dicarboxylate symporter